MDFPTQVLMPDWGYYILAGIVLLIIVWFYIQKKFFTEEGEFKPGFFTITFCCLLVLTISNILLEEHFKATFFFLLFGKPQLSTYLLFIVTLAFGLYGFTITWVWAWYKLKFKNEITPFMWEVINFTEEVRKDLNL